jgi:hypothetical protein
LAGAGEEVGDGKEVFDWGQHKVVLMNGIAVTI